MDGLGCAVAAISTSTTNCSLLSSVSATKAKPRRRPKNVSFTRKRNEFRVFAEKEDSKPKLDEYDQMELKFGKLIGEDPKLTLAKIMGRKFDPDASYIEIEKAFYKNKGKMVEIREIPFDVPKKNKASASTSDGLNLARPVPKKGFQLKPDYKSLAAEVKSVLDDGKMADGVKKSMVPNVILRKPGVFKEDDADDKASRYRVQSNLSLNMWKEQTREEFSDMTLLRKPGPVNPAMNSDKRGESQAREEFSDMTLLRKPGSVYPVMSSDKRDESITREESSDAPLLRKPGPMVPDVNSDKRDESQTREEFSDTPLLRKPGPMYPVMSSDKRYESRTREEFSDTALLRKPGPMYQAMNFDKRDESSEGDQGAKSIEDNIGFDRSEGEALVGAAMRLLERLEPKSVKTNLGGKEKPAEDAKQGKKPLYANRPSYTNEKNDVQGLVEAIGVPNVKERETVGNSIDEIQLNEENNASSTKEELPAFDLSDDNLLGSRVSLYLKNSLQGKPKRLDRLVKDISSSSVEEMIPVSYQDSENPDSLSQLEVGDWTRVENLVNTGERTEVEFISSSTRGFVVSSGSLIGFLPYRNLAAKWKFLPFESWLRQKGLDPANYKQQGLGVIGGSYDVNNRNSSLDSSLNEKTDTNLDGEISSDMTFEDLLKIYDDEKLKFLSSFVGQRINLNVVLADRKSKKLVFSSRVKEKEELVEKKRNVMAKLRVGDVVKCSVTKITYFGIFVEVEGVPALIHQSEVSWDDTLDPSSFVKVGEILEAKVHQLDVARERIFLSLKEITPDPLMETLESVVEARDTLEDRLVEKQPDVQWADVESLIKELQQVEGIQSVSKGRFFLSPGLAPTFQVYMASMFENEYKLLARSENKVQEVIVQTSLSKEEMKSAILKCTNKVE